MSIPLPTGSLTMAEPGDEHRRLFPEAKWIDPNAESETDHHNGDVG